MKRYSQLTKKQKAAAKEKCLCQLLQAILEGAMRFDDKANGDDLQKRINKAIAKADKMQTPWFAHEYILDTCRKDLERMASVDAQEAFYTEGERIVRGIL